MKNRELNIFFNLVKNETSLTEVFCNILQYKSFRDLFLKIVKEKNENIDISRIKFEDFKTEKITEHYGRFDLYLNSDEEYIFEIKIKNNTTLTENQPNNYLEYLKDNSNEDYNKNLFFILPRRYRHIDVIYSRWENYSKEEIKNYNIIFWEDILLKIKESGLNKLNILIDDFCKIMDYNWFYYEKIEFTKRDLKMLTDSNIPKMMKKLFDIVDGASNKFSSDIDKGQDRQTSNFYGYKIKDKHNINIWFGVDFEIW